MLRLQAPLPDDYTLATDDELVDRIAAAKSDPRRPTRHPRPPLPTRRGDSLGRLRSAIRSCWPGSRPTTRSRPTSSSAACTSWPSRPTYSPAAPAGHPPRPQRRLLDGRHGQPRPGRRSVGRDRGHHRDRPRRPDHLHELLGRAEGVRRAPRRRRVHVVERARRPRVGARRKATRCCSSPTSTWGGTPASRWATATPTCGVWNPHQECGGLEERDVKDATLLLWKGHCSVHQRFRPAHVEAARAEHPGIEVIVHPECAHDVVEVADRVGSTERIQEWVRAAPAGAASRSAPRSTWCNGWHGSTPTRRSSRSTR